MSRDSCYIIRNLPITFFKAICNMFIFQEPFSVRNPQIHYTCDSRFFRISWNFNHAKIMMFPDSSRNFSFKHHFFRVLDELRESWSCWDNTKLVNRPYFGSLLCLEQFLVWTFLSSNLILYRKQTQKFNFTTDEKGHFYLTLNSHNSATDKICQFYLNI